MEKATAAELDFDKGGGVIPVVTQDYANGRVLMVAYMDEEAWAKTRETGRAWFHSRTRGLWGRGRRPATSWMSWRFASTATRTRSCSG